MMSTNSVRKFVRKTSLDATEYRKNFRQNDIDITEHVTSKEACEVTPLMAQIYFRLANSPTKYWEKEGVLRFAGEVKNGKNLTAWEQLVERAGVSSATVRKALVWLHEEGVIGYFAGKNGAGIRIFFNRAASSIGRVEDRRPKVHLRLVSEATSNEEGRTSPDEVPFKDFLDSLDTDLDTGAPETSAAEAQTSDDNPPNISPEATLSEPQTTPEVVPDTPEIVTGGALNEPEIVAESAPGEPEIVPRNAPDEPKITADPRPNSERSTQFSRPILAPPQEKSRRSNEVSTDELITKMVEEIAPKLSAINAREHERTREWFNAHALPKAVRVAQRAAFDVLRHHGVIDRKNHPHDRAKEGGWNGENSPHEVTNSPQSDPKSRGDVPEQLTEKEVTEYAEACIALKEMQGQEIEEAVSKMGIEAGGFLPASEQEKVRAKLRSMGAL